ncbi:MAG: 30S ribosome-binding factor RbfA [Caulobacteraceae bacterium]
MKHARKGGRDGRAASGPSQRQLRAGELIRHALMEILIEEPPHDLEAAHVTVTEVRMSPDLRHAVCFCEPLGGVMADEMVAALNRHAKFLRGRLGRHIEMKFTPDLRFVHDESFETAARMEALLNRPEVRRDILSSSVGGSDAQGAPEGASDDDLPPTAAGRPLPPAGGEN